VSPTAPTFVTLNDQLSKAHRRIRELERRETELLAHNTTLCAIIIKLGHNDHPLTAELTPPSNDGSDGLGICSHMGRPTSQHLGEPPPQIPAQNLAPAGAPGSYEPR
jgi:hypothetical protein